MIKRLIKKLKALRLLYVRRMCDHKYNSDTQIKVIRCEECGDERWYDYKPLW
jgi:hypothetical protein